MTKHLFNRKSWILALSVLLIAAGITLLIQSNAQADEIQTITINGRTETAQCHIVTSAPDIEVCMSESYVCRIQDDNIQCDVKR